MLNIFYNPIYVKQKKVFLTKHLKHSIFLNYFISINYFLNRPTNEKYIQSGPHKRMNNLLHTFANDPKVNFNSIKYDNSYIMHGRHRTSNEAQLCINAARGDERNRSIHVDLR